MKKKVFPSNILQFIIFIILCLISIALVVKFDISFLKEYSESQRLALVTFLFFFFPIVIFYLANFGKKLYTFSLKSVNYRLFFIGLSFVISLIIVYHSSYHIMSNPTRSENPYEYNNLYFLFATCFIGPILEEIFFRGIILRSLIQTYSTRLSIVISSILFILVHTPSQYPLALLMGLFLGYVFFISKYNIILVIIFHVIFNNFSILYSYLLFNFSNYNYLLLIISIIIFFLSIYQLFKYVKNNKNLYYGN